MALRRRASVLALILLGSARALPAQSNEGALDLRFPLGARGTSMGGAAVAEQGGESVWWNPAGIARLKRAEFGIDHFSNFQVESGDAISILLPVARVGTFAIAARLFDYGATPVTDRETGEEIGRSEFRSAVLAGSFGTTFGERLASGVTFRVYTLDTPCSAVCAGSLTRTSKTATIDAGLQFRTSEAGPVTIGLLLSNAGLSLQVHDQPQADPPPTRLHVGATYTPKSASWDPNLSLRLSAELVTSIPGRALSSRDGHVGLEVGYRAGETGVFARGGYTRMTGESVGSGPSVGFGLSNQRVQLDIARVIESFSTELGKPPTYISIRVGL